MKGGKLQVHYGPTHYHLREECIKLKNADFDPVTDLVITATDYSRLLRAHKQLDEFGIGPQE